MHSYHKGWKQSLIALSSVTRKWMHQKHCTTATKSMTEPLVEASEGGIKSQILQIEKKKKQHSQKEEGEQVWGYMLKLLALESPRLLFKNSYRSTESKNTNMSTGRERWELTCRQVSCAQKREANILCWGFNFFKYLFKTTVKLGSTVGALTSQQEDSGFDSSSLWSMWKLRPVCLRGAHHHKPLTPQIWLKDTEINGLKVRHVSFSRNDFASNWIVSLTLKSSELCNCYLCCVVCSMYSHLTHSLTQVGCTSQHHDQTSVLKLTEVVHRHHASFVPAD